MVVAVKHGGYLVPVLLLELLLLEVVFVARPLKVLFGLHLDVVQRDCGSPRCPSPCRITAPCCQGDRYEVCEWVRVRARVKVMDEV